MQIGSDVKSDREADRPSNQTNNSWTDLIRLFVRASTASLESHSTRLQSQKVEGIKHVYPLWFMNVILLEAGSF